MLHHVCPSYIDERGHTISTAKNLKNRKRNLNILKMAQQWIKENKIIYLHHLI